MKYLAAYRKKKRPRKRLIVGAIRGMESVIILVHVASSRMCRCDEQVRPNQVLVAYVRQVLLLKDESNVLNKNTQKVTQPLL